MFCKDMQDGAKSLARIGNLHEGDRLDLMVLVWGDLLPSGRLFLRFRFRWEMCSESCLLFIALLFTTRRKKARL